jgi:hypothetical protein
MVELANKFSDEQIFISSDGETVLSVQLCSLPSPIQRSKVGIDAKPMNGEAFWWEGSGSGAVSCFGRPM